jgi:hypothetical protein
MNRSKSYPPKFKRYKNLLCPSVTCKRPSNSSSVARLCSDVRCHLFKMTTLLAAFCLLCHGIFVAGKLLSPREFLQKCEERGIMDLWNVGILPQHYTASQPRRPRRELNGLLACRMKAAVPHSTRNYSCLENRSVCHGNEIVLLFAEFLFNGVM